MKNIVRKAVIALLVCCSLIGTCPTASYAATSNTIANSTQTTDSKLENQITKIVKNNVKSTDSKKTKLKKLFHFVEKNYNYGRVIGFQTYDDWEEDYALEMCTKKKGSCYHYAASYAFLAKKATGYQVRIGVGETNGFNGNLQKHAWTEIKIGSKWYICDTNLDKYAASSSGKYCLKLRSSLKKTYNNYKNVEYTKVDF